MAKEKMTRIEWPKGSGRFALYAEDELESMRRLVRDAEGGRIPKRELGLVMGHVHDAKMTGGWLLTGPVAGPEEPPEAPVEPDPEPPDRQLSLG